MKDSQSIYSQYLSDKMLTDVQLRSLQRFVLSMLAILHDICTKYDIKYSLFAGSLLGAVRHGGFIPWDDDIDLSMKRTDYLRLKEIIAAHYSDKFYIIDNQVHKNYNLPFAKLMCKNTVLIEIGAVERNGVYIDLFLIDEAPKSHRFLRQKLYWLSNRLSSLVLDYRFPSALLRERAKSHKELKNYVRIRRLMGFFASIFPIRFYDSCRKLLLKGRKDKSQYVINGDFTLRYFDRNLIDDLVLYKFEGKDFFGPRDYNTMLSALYGKYMKLPPENQRARHILVELQLPTQLSLD